MLNQREAAEWARLSAWWLTWTPPEAPYQINSAVKVLVPSLCHAYYAARIKEGCTGQVQRGVLWMLREHWRMFGGPIACLPES